MKIFYDITVLLMTLLSIVLVSMIAITAVQNEKSMVHLLLRCTDAIRLKRGVKMWHE